MAEPSEYEIQAWERTQQYRGRRVSSVINRATETAVDKVQDARLRAERRLESNPRGKAVAANVKKAADAGAEKFKAAAHAVADAVPQDAKDWTGEAIGAARTTVGRVFRAGLSPKRVVQLHRKRGHDVSKLADLRRLDLAKIDDVGLRGADWYYPAAAAASGAGAGLIISGGELAIPVSGGVAAAPSVGVIAATFVGDATVVLGLGSRAVGHVSLLYGYDPEDPAEKLFIMSVVNAGTAISAGAKTAALADVSRLTQALVRGKTWEYLNKSVISLVSKRFAGLFTARFTKQSLGKIVPAAGIVIGGTFNWATLESIFDAANVAYRRRFLLEKYPQLAETSSLPSVDDTDVVSEDDDETISVLADLRDAGGPDLT